MKQTVLVFCASFLKAYLPKTTAVEAVDSRLIPEARKVLNYLESVYGKKTLSGMASYGGWRPVFEICGRAPAIYSTDAFGWNKPKFGPSYNRVMENMVNTSSNWWHEKGGIVAMQFHWGKPGDPNGSAWVSGGKGHRAGRHGEHRGARYSRAQGGDGGPAPDGGLPRTTCQGACASLVATAARN